jgi:hypothetical protein
VAGHTAIDGAEFARLRERLGFGRLALQGLLPLTGAAPVDGGYRVECYESLLPKAWGSLNAKLGGPRVSNRQLFDVDPAKSAPFYDVAGVRLVVRAKTTPALAAAGRTVEILEAYRVAQQARATPWPALPPGLAVERVANEDALDRTYFVNRFALTSMDAALDHVVAGDLDFRSLVLLDRDPGMMAWSASTQYRPTTIVSYTAERVSIDVDAPTAGFVVLTDSYYPGWRAWVDADEVEIFRANGLYRAVPTGPGHHRVTFVYAPASLAWGLRIGGASIGLLVLLPLAGRRYRRRERRAGAARELDGDLAEDIVPPR